MVFLAIGRDGHESGRSPRRPCSRTEGSSGPRGLLAPARVSGGSRWPSPPDQPTSCRRESAACLASASLAGNYRIIVSSRARCRSRPERPRKASEVSTKWCSRGEKGLVAPNSCSTKGSASLLRMADRPRMPEGTEPGWRLPGGLLAAAPACGRLRAGPGPPPVMMSQPISGQTPHATRRTSLYTNVPRRRRAEPKDASPR